VFTANSRGRGRCAIELELAHLGISYHHSTPYHPQTCGKVERFHQTLKRWLAKQPPADGVVELQAQLDWFRDYYNTVRPHRALRRTTPAKAFAARPPAAPSRPGAVFPSHYRIRRDRIDPSGVVTLRYDSRLHHIGLGRRHAGTRVLVLVADLDVRVVSEDGGCCASSSSTRAATTSGRRGREVARCPETSWSRCPETSGHGNVPRHHTVPPAGIEPATPGLGNRCSIH
jgi:hypothetical protein